MEDFRSRSYAFGDGRTMQLEPYYGGGGGSTGRPGEYYGPPPTAAGIRDLRSYSASYAGAPAPPPKLKKGGSKASSSSSSSKGWSLSDPEFQRRRRVASYKVYGVEGKVKGTFRKGVRWLKDRYTQALYGFW